MKFGHQLYAAVALSLFSASISLAAAVPAFPGAEGFGTDTPGGRGGKVIEVTNVNDHGPGSLREAVDTKGPRTVVFRVSGTIPLETDLEIVEPFITIAGQTAPGDGICLKNYKLGICTNDVIVRFLRVRRGASSKLQDDCLGLYNKDGNLAKGKGDADVPGNAMNVVVDHCSLSWSCDETVNTWHGTKNATIQWCIISEALHNAVHPGHGFAATLGGVNTTYHHNLLADCPGRDPSIAGNNDFQTINLDFRNNMVFNYMERVIDGKPNSINFVANYYKPGPASEFKDHLAKLDTPNYKKIGTPKWYIAGNVMEGNEAISKDNRAGVKGETQFLVDKPADVAPVKTDDAHDLPKIILPTVGAFLPKRDPVDTRIVDEVRSDKPAFNKGVVKDPSQVGGWPELKSTPAPSDSDHDGMPDEWEKAHGLNPNDPADGAKDSGNGYTNLELYLNGLVPAPGN